MEHTSNNYFLESASERTDIPNDSIISFGAFQDTGIETFEDNFRALQKTYYEQHGIDIRKDIDKMVKDPIFMNQYKEDLMKPVFEGFLNMSPNDPHIGHIMNNVERFWDTKVRLFNESAVLNFLPIATLEFPVLLKQFFQSIMKDIIEVETIKTPNFTKHIRTLYVVDNNTGDKYEYPKCLFDGTWEKIWDAGKGHPIKETVVPFVNGRLFKYDIIANCTDGTPGIDTLSLQFKIIGIKVGADTIMLRGNGITVEFSTNGTFVNGDLNFDYNGTTIADTLGGRVNFEKGTIDISSASGQVEGVIFSGFLSNEKNLRSAQVLEKREILRFTIEDSKRWSMPFSIEEIEDSAALLDFNYYNRMVDDIIKCQEMEEGMTVIKFLQDEFKKYFGINTDIYKLEPIVLQHTVDIKPPVGYAGDPFKYISSAIQFRLKSLIHRLIETSKLEGLSFVIVGNSLATNLISEFSNWKVQQGASIGGIRVNNSYGFATDMGANVRIVASNLYDAYSIDPSPTTNKRELILHIYAYPTTPEHISFKHIKYTSHLLNSQTNSAYQHANAPGGAFNIVTALSRFKTITVQGIQARLIIDNSELVYGPAPKRPPITGAPYSA